MLFLLKAVAYLDDPQRRIKDLGDIHGLLKFYERDSDRTFSDAVFAARLPDVEFIPAFLLGTDVALVCRLEERAIIERFLNAASNSTSPVFSLLLRHEGIFEPSEERLLGRFKAFTKGFGLHHFGT